MRFITKTHQFWSSVNKILSKSFVVKTYQIQTRQAERWAADPATCSDTCRNPLDLLVNTFKPLHEINRGDVIEAALRLLAEPFGFELKKKQIESDTGVVIAELMDVQTVLGSLAGRLKKCLEDDDLEQSERTELLPIVDMLVREALELKDAIKRGECK